ncbi:MAG TPA: AI-2E family transporter [Lachnospiraceae bacterium]|nr:AI-2E family transporter [Lachnospiraceae bacterium]
MKNEEFKKHLYLSIMGFVSIALSVVFFFCVYRSESFLSSMKGFFGILKPFVYGGVIAYMLTPICVRLEKLFDKIISPNAKKPLQAKAIARKISVGLSHIIGLLLLVGLFYLVLPQVVTSVTAIAESMPNNMQRFYSWSNDYMLQNPKITHYLNQYLSGWLDNLNTWINTDFMVNVQKIVAGFSAGLMGAIGVIKNIIIGCVVSIYFLEGRSHFLAQARKLIYCCFSVPMANAVIGEVRFANKIFGGFIRGKLLDSLIIGIICFAVCTIMDMPYTMLLSVIIGITNIIPFVGPFIGAVPCLLLILTVSPVQSFYFLIFIIILQQFDGNILGPKILGQSTGVSGFWVLFAILFFGGLFGFVGMILGVPAFAVIYNLTSQFVNKKLLQKKLSNKTTDYENVDTIDEKTIKMV